MKQCILAVTGAMAAGKNTVSEILEQEGFLSVDADTLVHTAVETEKEAILARFGAIAAQRGIALLHDDGTVNRRAVGSLIFSDTELLAAQEAIIHPAVNAMLEHYIEAHPDKNIVLNATVLYKTPVISRCNAIIFVDAPAIIRFFRVLKRDKLPVKEILKRFSSQKNIFAQYKSVNADIYRVKNTCSRKVLRTKLLKLLRTCEKKG